MRQALGPGALGRPGGSGWRGRWEGGSGWGRHVNSRTFHFNVWQNSLQIKKKKKKKTNQKKKKKKKDLLPLPSGSQHASSPREMDVGGIMAAIGQSSGHRHVGAPWSPSKGKNPQHGPIRSHLVMIISWFSNALSYRCPGSGLPGQVAPCPYLISRPPMQAVRIELVDVQHVNGTFDAEMM